METTCFSKRGGVLKITQLTPSSPSSLIFVLSSFSPPFWLLFLLLLFLQTARLLLREGLPNTRLSPVLQLGWWHWARRGMRIFGKTPKKRLTSNRKEKKGFLHRQRKYCHFTQKYFELPLGEFNLPPKWRRWTRPEGEENQIRMVVNL